MTPRRIQRRRTAGWRMPEGARYVGRGTIWGNPFVVGGWFKMGDPDEMRGPFGMAWCEAYPQAGASTEGFTLIKDAETAVEWFRRLREKYPLNEKQIAELRGHDLACWCPLDRPCHADVLLAIANGWPLPDLASPEPRP